MLKQPSSRSSESTVMDLPFHLDDAYIERYSHLKPPFGFNGLGELIYKRTYARTVGDRQEEWFETVRRVVEGTYSIQKEHIESFHLGWDDDQGQASAQEMYHLIFTMKFLPPGRGLYAMGTEMVHKKKLAAALNNCAFVSTADLKTDLTMPFEFLMDATMLGVGVGFDTKGANQLRIFGPDTQNAPERFVIEDSREGWVASLGALLQSYFGKLGRRLPQLSFDYSHIRQKGTPLKTFGGKSSGSGPLIELHSTLRELLDQQVGKLLSSSTIVDIFNIIGKCVVGVGNIRCAEIAFGEEGDTEFLDLKDYKKNPHRAAYGWTSNNSVFASIGMDYQPIVDRICKNGEPGLCWLENMRAYGRMSEVPNYKDSRVCGGNPCLEQSLESYEMCCLVETFPAHHQSLEEYLRTLKFAYLYAKTVTLCMTHWPNTNRVMLRNRRIGCSVSGIAQFLAQHSIEELKTWMNRGYATVQEWDSIYSSWLCIPHSIKTTSVKPSGTVSLLAGATPGIHYPESRFYIRRIRIQNDSALIDPLRHAGYSIVPCVGLEATTSVVEIPVDIGAGVRVASEVSVFEQLSLASFMQKYWADNQVSCTVTFDLEKEAACLASSLNYYQYQLKGISLLPRVEYGAFPQMPYEMIDEEEYTNLRTTILPIAWSSDPQTASDAPTCPTGDTAVPLPPPDAPIASRSRSKKTEESKKKRYIGFKIQMDPEAATASASASESEEDGLCNYPDAVSFCDSEKCHLY